MLSNQEIGQRLKTVRENAGLTLQEVADEIGVTKSTISRYEKGSIEHIKLPVIEAISRILKVNCAWVLGKTDVKEISETLKTNMELTIHETNVMQAYREQSAMQPAVDKLLGVAADEKDEKEKIQPAKSGKSVSLPVNRPEEKSSEADVVPDEGIRVFRAAKSINND